MRILLIVHRALPHSTGGVELWADALARGFHGHGHEVAILSLVEPGEGAMFSVHSETSEWGTSFWLNHRLSAARNFRDTWQDPRLEQPLTEVLTRFRPDVVHLAHPDGWGVWPLRSARSHGAITVATLHDYKWICGRGQMVRPPGERCQQVDEDQCTRCLSDQLTGRAGRTLLRRLAPERLRTRIRVTEEQTDTLSRPEPGQRARQRWRTRQLALLASLRDADLVISPSRFVADRLQSEGLDRLVTVIPNGLDAPEAPRPSPSVAGPLRVGFFGNPHPSKGIKTVVEAVASRPAGSVHLLLFGASDSDLEAAVTGPTEPNLLSAMGPYPPGSGVEHMRDVDIVVIPSIWDENHPLVAIEARLAGKPVLVSDRGGLPELVQDAVDGWVLPAGDAAAWGERIGLLATNRWLLRQVAAAVVPPSSGLQMAASHLRAYEECGASRTRD